MLLATLCYVKRDGYTLMVYRNKKADDIHQGKWNGLGGKFEAGESPEECVRREILEESGLSIHNPKLCGLLMFPKFKGNDRTFRNFVHAVGTVEAEAFRLRYRSPGG